MWDVLRTMRYGLRKGKSKAKKYALEQILAHADAVFVDTCVTEPTQGPAVGEFIDHLDAGRLSSDTIAEGRDWLLSMAGLFRSHGRVYMTYAIKEEMKNTKGLLQRIAHQRGNGLHQDVVSAYEQMMGEIAISSFYKGPATRTRVASYADTGLVAEAIAYLFQNPEQKVAILSADRGLKEALSVLALGGYREAPRTEVIERLQRCHLFLRLHPSWERTYFSPGIGEIEYEQNGEISPFTEKPQPVVEAHSLLMGQTGMVLKALRTGSNSCYLVKGLVPHKVQPYNLSWGEGEGEEAYFATPSTVILPCERSQRGVISALYVPNELDVTNWRSLQNILHLGGDFRVLES